MLPFDLHSSTLGRVHPIEALKLHRSEFTYQQSNRVSFNLESAGSSWKIMNLPPESSKNHPAVSLVF
jgi:hypothetical protein